MCWDIQTGPAVLEPPNLQSCSIKIGESAEDMPVGRVPTVGAKKAVGAQGSCHEAQEGSRQGQEADVAA